MTLYKDYSSVGPIYDGQPKIYKNVPFLSIKKIPVKFFIIDAEFSSLYRAEKKYGFMLIYLHAKAAVGRSRGQCLVFGDICTFCHLRKHSVAVCECWTA